MIKQNKQTNTTHHTLQEAIWDDTSLKKMASKQRLLPLYTLKEEK